jgi:hypothetical protein
MAGPERALRELADAWIEAFNARDLDAVLELAADDVEFVTLHRGTLTRDDFPAFFERQSYGVGIYVIPKRWIEHEGVLVVEATVEFRFVETGDVAGSGDGAASFRGGDGRIARVKLHQSVEAALASDP